METPKTSTDAQHVRQVVDQRATAEGRRYMWLHRKKHDIFVEIQKLKIRGTALASAGGRKRERDLRTAPYSKFADFFLKNFHIMSGFCQFLLKLVIFVLIW